MVVAMLLDLTPLVCSFQKKLRLPLEFHEGKSGELQPGYHLSNKALALEGKMAPDRVSVNPGISSRSHLADR